MTDSPAPQTTPAVRIARFARPGFQWASDGEGNAYERYNDDHMFFLGSLDYLALAERKLIEAGLGVKLATKIAEELSPGDGLDKWCFYGAVAFAPAEARARAILAVLDANPHLENPDAR